MNGSLQPPSVRLSNPGWLFVLNFLTARFHVRDVSFVNDDFQRRLTVVGLVGEQMLLDIFGTFDDDFF
jgi:hypothetical protein